MRSHGWWAAGAPRADARGPRGRRGLMDWIDYAWPLMGGISVTLGLIYLFVWSRQRHEPAMLVFAVLAAEMAALALLELLAMQSETPAAYSALLHGAEFVVAL